MGRERQLGWSSKDSVGSARSIGWPPPVRLVIDNHPMSILNMMAIGSGEDAKPLLAALLWMDLLRRNGIEIGIGRFLRLGTVVLIPTLVLSLLILWAL